MRALSILTAACVFTSVARSAADEPTDLLALRDAYRENIEERSEGLREQFGSSLQQLEKSLASASKLEEALAVRAKRTAHEDKGATGQPADTAGLPQYVRLAEAYNRNLEGVVRPLRDSYQRALLAMEKKFVDEGKLQDALAVKTERESLAVARSEPAAAVTRKPGTPSDAEELEKYLTYTVWEYRDSGQFRSKPGYIFFHQDGKSFLGPSTGAWKATSASSVELFPRGSSREKIELSFDGDAKSFSATTDGSTEANVQGKLLSLK